MIRLSSVLVASLPLLSWGSLSEISVNLQLAESDYVVGERVKGIVDVVNSSPDKLRCGFPGARDRLFVEVFRSSDHSQLSRISKEAFVGSFELETGEGQKLTTYLADHYDLRYSARYLAKPVLVHDGVRYEGQPRVFDVVDGVRLAHAMQLFSGKRGLQREFELVYWSIRGNEHLFLKARDLGTSTRRWETRDLGPILRQDEPMIGVLPTGEILTMHRLNADQFIRGEFWSLPDELVYRGRQTVQDPETAGTKRVRELYKEGGVKPVENPWWKFW